MDLGIYCIYPAVDLFGLPNNIISRAGFLESGADGYGTTIFEYDNMMLTMTWSKLAQGVGGSQILGDGGTVHIGSISQLNDITYCKRDAQPVRVVQDMEKHVIMSHEAKAFLQFIEQPQETAERYDEASRMALTVSRVMEQIRKLSGIRFTC